jgi:hypothetical protein
MNNGVDKLHKWDGAAAAVVAVSDSAAYAARYLEPFGARLIAAHMSEVAVQADRVRWSSDGDADIWTPTASNGAGATDTIDLPGEITGMKQLSGINYIFKRNGLIAMRLTGLLAPAFVFQTVTDGIGCISGGSVVDIRGRLYFLGADDVYAFDGASRPVGIGTGIRDEIFESINYGRLRQVFAFHHAAFNEYWLCIPIGTSTDATSADAYAMRCYVYNYIEQAWGRANVSTTAHTLGRSSGSFLAIDDMDFPIDDWVTPIDSGFGGTDVLFPVVAQPAALPSQVVHTSSATGAATRTFTDTSSEYIAQGFQVGSNIDANQIRVNLRISAGAPTGIIECAIYNEAASDPDAALPGAGFTDFNTIPATALTGSFVEQFFTLDTAVALTTATQYYIVLRHSAAVAGNTVGVEDDAAGAYANGAVTESTDGSSWSDVPAADINFSVEVGPFTRMLQIDDNVISDRGTSVNVIFHTPDVRLYPPNEPPRQVTVHRVILTVRDRGSGSYQLELSGDAGQTFVSLGSKTTPSLNVNALVNLVYPARFTSPFVRTRIQTSNPMAIQKLTYEYFERTELR